MHDFDRKSGPHFLFKNSERLLLLDLQISWSLVLLEVSSSPRLHWTQRMRLSKGSLLHMRSRILQSSSLLFPKKTFPETTFCLRAVCRVTFLIFLLFACCRRFFHSSLMIWMICPGVHLLCSCISFAQQYLQKLMYWWLPLTAPPPSSRSRTSTEQDERSDLCYSECRSEFRWNSESCSSSSLRMGKSGGQTVALGRCVLEQGVGEKLSLACAFWPVFCAVLQQEWPSSSLADLVASQRSPMLCFLGVPMLSHSLMIMRMMSGSRIAGNWWRYLLYRCRENQRYALLRLTFCIKNTTNSHPGHLSAEDLEGKYEWAATQLPSSPPGGRGGEQCGRAGVGVSMGRCEYWGVSDWRMGMPMEGQNQGKEYDYLIGCIVFG